MGVILKTPMNDNTREKQRGVINYTCTYFTVGLANFAGKRFPKILGALSVDCGVIVSVILLHNANIWIPLPRDLQTAGNILL